ncbi:MAG: hypothetical protein WCS51_04620 [Bacilli bacterium]
MSRLAAHSISCYNAQWNKKSGKSTFAFADTVKIGKVLSDKLKYKTAKPVKKNSNKLFNPIYN